MSTRRIHSDDILVSRVKALLRKHGGPDPDVQAAEIERLQTIVSDQRQTIERLEADRRHKGGESVIHREFKVVGFAEDGSFVSDPLCHAAVGARVVRLINGGAHCVVLKDFPRHPSYGGQAAVYAYLSAAMAVPEFVEKAIKKDQQSGSQPTEAERDALRSEVENLKNWREDAEKYIESLTTMVVKQRDRAEKAEKLLRAYEAVGIRREEDGNSR